MAGLDNLWSRFSLFEEEEQGIKTAGDNVLLFEFKDILDLEKVLKFEPWTSDKSLVVFQRVTTIEEIPRLEFSKATFWVQIHNVPENCLSQATGELIGGTIGTVIQVADPEDDGAGNEFLRVRVSIDIEKLLPRCRKDCELWLCGKGTMKKGDQKFGEWMRADSYKSFRKTVSIVHSNARSQAPWWRKPDSCPKERSSMANPVRHSDNRVVGGVLAGRNFGNDLITRGGKLVPGGVWEPTPLRSVSCLSWNCRGFGNPQTEDELVALVSSKDLKLVFLMETKVEKPTMERMGGKMSFNNIFMVPRLNRMGGLALLWRDDLSVDVQTYFDCHIDAIVDHRVDDT
uniref:DUF4283 domain-containing protein n=1 Tax=Quercus lobata TaxID=97700 RepID=A0A7N2LHI8_QUELO